MKNDWSSWKVRRAAGAGGRGPLRVRGDRRRDRRHDGARTAAGPTCTSTGPKAGEIDAWIPEGTYDNDYWHVTGLPNGKHTVRIVVRADADGRSKGRHVQLERAIVYGPRP